MSCCCGRRRIQIPTGIGYANRLNRVCLLLTATKLERMVLARRRRTPRHLEGQSRNRTVRPTQTQTDLTANLVQKGIRRGVEAVKSGVERLKRGEDTSKPYFSADSVVYDKRSATFHRDHVSLSTVDVRIECDYVLPDDSDIPPTKYVADEDFEFRMSHLQHLDGEWYLHASMQKKTDEKTPESTAEHRTVLGVDLGVNNLAVTSTGTFWSADVFNHWRREYEKRRGDLQQCGSRHAHENIESVGRKETGRFEIALG